MRRTIRSVLAGAALLLVTATSAQAATTIGQTFNPRPDITCEAGGTFLQKGSPGNSYATPSAGVITAWSYEASGTASALKFQVGRLAGANTYRIVGASPLVAPAMSQLNTYNDVRISVQPGDVIGLYMTTGGFCTQFNPQYTGALHSGGEVLPGADGVFTDRASFIYDVSARLEPDADGDGFGDETQDLCSTDARRQTTCPTPPETTIVGAPKKKIGKPKAKFSFESSEAGSTFKCRLKGRNLSSVVKQLGPCTSPTKYTGLARGKYKFFVLATDAAGSPDPTPATRKFKVVD